MTFASRFACALGAIVLFLSAPQATAADSISLNIGTGSPRGVYYPTGRAICRMLEAYGRAQRKDYACQARESLGSVANLQGLAEGQIDLGIVQSDTHYQAFKGIRKFQDKPITELRSMFSLHAESFTIVARANLGARRLRDLKGRRINVGKKGSGPRETFLELMASMGWDANEFGGFTQFGTRDQVKALCDGRTDVITYVVGHPASAIREALQDCNTNLISVYGPGVQALLKKWPYYRDAQTPAGLYRGTTTDIRTFGLSATLVTTTKLDADTAYAITAAIFGHLSKFRSMHPALKYLSDAEMVRDSLTAPLHEGALRYFRENGLL